MTTLETTAVLLQLAMPLALIAWVAIGRRRTRTAWALDVALAASYLVAVAFAAPWLALPWYLPWILLALLAAAAAPGARRVRGGDNDDLRPRGTVGLVVRVVVVALLAGVGVLALAGRQRFDAAPVDLAFPLRGGTYLVASGGSREIVNPHLKTREATRYRAYRGQSYAVDVVKLGTWGSRRSRLSPDDPRGFAIFGDSLHAPCSGSVIRAVDGHPDRLARGAAPRTLEGNHVILVCDAVWVVLAHMERGSVRVEAGDVVAEGDVLGLVGNSGRSDEPHLHIHAQTPGTPEAPLGGEPVPITFGGRHMVRNDRIGG